MNDNLPDSIVELNELIENRIKTLSHAKADGFMFYAKHLQSLDKIKQAAVADHQYISSDEASSQVSNDLNSRFHRMVSAMGLPASTKLYIVAKSTGLDDFFPRAFGKDVIVSRPYLSQLNTEQAASVIGHELAHVLNNDYASEAELIDPKLARAEEKRADIIGSGPNGSCNPQALAAALTIGMQIQKRIFIAMNPDSTDADFDASLGTDHPVLSERIAYLQRTSVVITKCDTLVR